MTVTSKARDFAIWRYANAKDWDCSYDEIADDTGLTRNQVLYSIKRNGWGGKISRGRGRHGFTSIQTSKGQHTKGFRADENTLDLCDLIGRDFI